VTGSGIGPADLADPRLAALVAAHLAATHAESPPESRHALALDGLRAPDVQVWSLSLDGAPAAIGALRALSACDGEVKSMFVAPGARGRGLGALMLAHALAAADAAGMARVNLETGVTPCFGRATALCRAFGCVDCPPFGDYRTDPNSLFLTLAIAEPTLRAT
jgi:putative acetyltransferase